MNRAGDETVENNGVMFAEALTGDNVEGSEKVYPDLGEKERVIGAGKACGRKRSHHGLDVFRLETKASETTIVHCSQNVPNSNNVKLLLDKSLDVFNTGLTGKVVAVLKE